MATWQRTHTCGELTTDDVGKPVVLNGWIENHRHHGGILFVDVRDRYGVTQVVVDQERGDAVPGALESAAKLGAEDVVSVRGEVVKRDPDKINPKRITGAIEVLASQVDLLSEAETPPFEILDEAEANEELRMRFRYLDLRRRPMQRALERRAAMVRAVRNYLADREFVEVETPVLTKSTPEGARDYLVPSRVSPGQFYALPQSPQIFKQLMMVSGMDRYYQIARCFRDEDLRADRQPEFTQFDLEMSFVEEDDVLELVEGMMVAAFGEVGIEVPQPFPRLTHEEAARRYGSDKPDLRFGMELIDVSELVAQSDFKVFAGAVADGGSVAGLCVEGQASNFSRKDIDALQAYAGEYGARGLAWAKVGDDGALTGPISKFFGDEKGTALCEAMGAGPGSLMLFVADRTSVVRRALGELRVKLGGQLGLRKQGDFRFAWVTEFPMFDYNEDRGRWDSTHHPFTAPVDWDIDDFSKDTAAIRSRAYDLVLNGWELGSGSIRIHRRDVQEKIFDFLGITKEEQESRFGFMLEAFRYGAPPHGGIALGVDRVIALSLGLDSIRDVIAFPKTTSATDVMCNAPSPVAPEQLADLHIVAQTPPKPEPSS